MKYIQGALDELVYEVLANKACDINNSGQECQIEFLLEEGWSLDDIIAKAGDII